MVKNSTIDKKYFSGLILSYDNEKLFKQSLLHYIHDAQLSIYISFQKTENWKYSFIDPIPDYKYEGEFLSALFKRLENFMNNSEIINYYITEIFLKFIRFPHPAIYSYFLSTNQTFPSTYKTLRNLLLEVII